MIYITVDSKRSILDCASKNNYITDHRITLYFIDQIDIFIPGKTNETKRNQMQEDNSI